MATEEFRRVVESLRIAVAIADSKGEIAFANAALAQLSGREAKAIAGTGLAALFVAEDRKRVEQNAARVGEGRTASAEIEARLAGGGKDERWVQVSLHPALDDRDKASGVVAILQAIDQQRETEGALHLAAARLLALAEASPGAVLVENAAGDIELANEALCRLLGLDSAPQSLMGLAVGDVFEKTKRVEAGAVERARKKKDATEIAVKLEGGGSAKLLRQPVVVDEKPAGALWTSREPGSGASFSGATSASEVALIEKIGEELSVALEGISAIAIRAQQMEFDPALVEHFQVIRGSTETAMAAIGDLVDFSKVSGGVVLRKGEFGLRSALADLIKRVSAEAEEKGCRLRMRIEQDVADRLEGDLGRLLLVLKNLLDSAFQIAPGTEVSLQIVPEYVTESGIQLSFSVSASPEGGGKLTLSAPAESGMGVAVARFMVAAMGGRLEVTSRGAPDALYSFTIEFPVRAAPPAPKRPTYVSLVGMTVIFVSGDREQRLTVSNLLRGWRMVPLEADNAPMALALLERMHEEGSPVPLVIVTDQLQVQDGFLLAFRVKHHSRLGPTLLMMLASKGKPGDAIACRENGISAYMRYPINERQLNDAIVAVTGASVDSDNAPTLVTRHSLREQRKGATILLVDPNRDSQILASHILSKRECSVVVAQDAREALAALEQDVFDLVLVDAGLPGLDMPDTPAKLRSAIQRNPDRVRLIASTLDHRPAWSAARIAEGYDGTIGKPFNKEHLLEVLAELPAPDEL